MLVVATPEPTSLTDAYATIKVLATTQGRREVRLVVNQARRPGDGRTVRQQLQQVIDRYVSPALDAPVQLELLGEVPTDAAVRESVLRRQLLLEHLPGTPAAMAIVARRHAHARPGGERRRPTHRWAASRRCARSSTTSTT